MIFGSILEVVIAIICQPVEGHVRSEIFPAAQEEGEPSSSKIDLINRYLDATGWTARIEGVGIFERFTLPSSDNPLFAAAMERNEAESLPATLDRMTAAVERHYAPHREDFRNLYVSHVHWEYEEAELRQIVEFLESPAGRHYRDGNWRMEAYNDTNTEDDVAEIIAAAAADLRAE